MTDASMKLTLMLSGAALALAVSACAPGPRPAMGGGTPAAGTPPISNAGASAQGMPQSANSLPSGARVNSPVAPQTGAIGSTRVTPR